MSEYETTYSRPKNRIRHPSISNQPRICHQSATRYVSCTFASFVYLNLTISSRLHWKLAETPKLTTSRVIRAPWYVLFPRPPISLLLTFNRQQGLASALPAPAPSPTLDALVSTKAECLVRSSPPSTDVTVTDLQLISCLLPSHPRLRTTRNRRRRRPLRVQVTMDGFRYVPPSSHRLYR